MKKKKRLFILLGSLCLMLVIAVLPFVVNCAKAPTEVTPTEPGEVTPTEPGEVTPTKPTEFKPIELIFSHQIPSLHTRHTQVIGPLFTDEIEKRTDGRVKVTVYFAQALALSDDQLDACIAGTFDMTETSPGSKPGVFPAHAGVEMQFYLGIFQPLIFYPQSIVIE